MSRFASAILVLGGAALLLAWQVSPATSAPDPAPRPIESPLDQIQPVLSDVDAQVEKLRARLAEPSAYPPPSRDPFNFGKHPEPARVTAPEPVAPVAPPPPPPPALPHLVAIVSTPTDGGMLRTAVFAVADDVQILKPGEKIGALVVRSIGLDAVIVVDPSTGVSYRVK
jgi:hypothetical protein